MPSSQAVDADEVHLPAIEIRQRRTFRVTLHHRAIVITTINRPTEPMNRFARLDDWQLFVVADRKTPVPWQAHDAVFLPVDDNRYALSTRLPYDHYSRKMLGYLAAV